MTKKVADVEIRFSSPMSSRRRRGGEARVMQFKTEYLLVFEDGSRQRVTRNLARSSKTFNTTEFTCAIQELLSELTRNVDTTCNDLRCRPV
jgi:hypothetical protein